MSPAIPGFTLPTSTSASSTSASSTSASSTSTANAAAACSSSSVGRLGRGVGAALVLSALVAPVAAQGASGATRTPTSKATIIATNPSAAQASSATRISSSRIAHRRPPRTTSTPTPTPSTTATTTSTPLASSGTSLFAGVFDSAAGYASMTTNPSNLVYGQDYGVTTLPGTTKKVGFFDSYATKSTSNGFPRAGMRTPLLIKPAAQGNKTDEYWVAFDYSLPASNEMKTYGQWMTPFTPAYGAPYNGPSPLGLAIVPAFSNGKYAGYNRWQMGGDPSVLGESWKVAWGKNVQVVVHFKFAYASKGGFVELFVLEDGSNAYRRIPIKGNATGPVSYDAMKAGVNDGYYTGTSSSAAYASVGVYGDVSMTHRAYSTTLRIGTGSSSVVTSSAAGGWRTVPLPK